MRNFYDLGDKALTDRETLVKFVDEHFHPPGRNCRFFFRFSGTELTDCTPEDWQPFPNNFMKIKDFHLRRWALHLHRIWRDLCRKVSPTNSRALNFR